MVNKVILLILDSVGIGELPDAAAYGDEGSHTLGNIFKVRGNMKLPNLFKLGLGNIQGVRLPVREDHPLGAFGKAKELSAGKDTTTGHWEIAGIVLDRPFPVYPNGFPEEIIERFEKAIGRKVLWNKPASGTEIIKRLGQEHMKTGYPIVYTSADSVFQVAAHEEVIPLDELYDMCRIARAILQGPHGVGRVIARPFKGEPGNFYRTENRKDFSLEPVAPTILDVLSEKGLEVAAVGKIRDIFAGRGISRSVHTHNNEEGIEATLEEIKKPFKGLIFTNLVDYDMLYGHRNDVEGYAKALERFDLRIPDIMDAMSSDDVLIITADHGCDPTTESTDHSREYIPILVYGEQVRPGVDLGIRESYSDIGATVLDLFDIHAKLRGRSFKKEMIKER